jgi:hypothetical protein
MTTTKSFKHLMAAFALAGVSASAMALTIVGPTNPSPTPPDGSPAPICWTLDAGGADTTFINACGPFSPAHSYDSGDLLFKQDTSDTGPGVETGSLAGSYTGSFTPSGDINSLTIKWDGPSAAKCLTSTFDCLLVVKDGNVTFARYLYNLSDLGWNGTDDIVLTGFWVGTGGSISHAAIYGATGEVCVRDCGPTRVPEPQILALLGLGLALGGLTLRRRRSN